MQIFVAGMNHRTAPIDARERFACVAEREFELFSLLSGNASVTETLVLSTCNRFEVYCVGRRNAVDIEKIVESIDGLSGAKFRAEQCYIRIGEEALAHLFRVASGLDAMVVGETQVLGQLKMAYQRAWEAGTTGPVLNRALHRAFFVAKRVHTESGIGRKPVSVASIAAQHAASLVGDAGNARALVVGAGAVGTSAARGLVREGFACVSIAGREPAKTNAAATDAGATPISWSAFPSQLAKADVVVAATSSKRSVIGPQTIKSALGSGRAGTLNIIDLGIPRNVASSVSHMKGLRLITVDDLKPLADANRAERLCAAREAEALVEEEARRFAMELPGRRFAETISALSQKIESVRSREFEKLVESHPELTAKQRSAIDAACRSIAAKILCEPARYLKNNAHDEDERFMSSDILKRIFRL